MMLTKTETRTIFDRGKIGVGDIVEYCEYKFRLFFGDEVYNRVAGVVTKVEADCLWISARRGVFDDCLVENFGLPVERADELRIIYRHPLNERKR